MESYSDPDLDQQLRDVSVPDGLLARLRRPDPREALSWTDQQLDAELFDVVVPGSLVTSLQRIPEDTELDKRLCDVEVPWSLTIQLRHAERPPFRPKVASLVRAAMIFLAIGVLYHFGVAMLFSGLRPELANEDYLDVEYNGPLEIEGVSELQVQLAVEESPVVTVGVSELPTPNVAIFAPSRIPVFPRGPAGELIDSLSNGLDLDADVLLMSYGTLGYPQRVDDHLPRFEDPPPPPRGGLEPPLVRNFNRRFLWKYGVNPPVFPGLDRSLRTSAAPLTTSTRSFDISKRRLADERLPAANEVLVEDFLAATTFAESHPAAGDLSLSVAAAPSIFGASRGDRVLHDLGWRPGPAELLQVSAVAGPAPRDDRPVQLTIALDISSSMRWEGRLETAKAAIKHLAGQLNNDDRISLLAFNERAQRNIEGIERGGLSQLAQFLEPLRADGGTNLPLALQRALSMTFESAVDMDAEPVLVLMTDGRTKLPDETLGQLRHMFRLAKEQGLRFLILEMNEEYDADPALAELRRALGGDKRTGLDSQTVKRALLEALGGRGTLVAADAKLTVTFDPNVVFAYRLIGHDTTSEVGLVAAAVETNLHAGEVATCLFEIWLRPGLKGTVANCHLQWIGRETGRTLHKRREIGTVDFAATFWSAPMPLQCAAVAAETAETLRGSPLAASRNRSLTHVLGVTERMSSESFSRHEFHSLLRLVEDVERVRLSRHSPTRGD